MKEIEPLAMLLSKNHLGMLYDFVGYHVVFLCSIYFVCTCFFVDKNLSDSSSLRKLIHMRDGTSLFDILFLWCPPYYSFWIFGGSGKEVADECLFYLITSLRTHIRLGHKLWILFASYWACEPSYVLVFWYIPSIGIQILCVGMSC